MTKTTEYKTKKKQQLEATAKENQSEVIEWMKTQFTAADALAELLRSYEGKENDGERH